MWGNSICLRYCTRDTLAALQGEQFQVAFVGEELNFDEDDPGLAGGSLHNRAGLLLKQVRYQLS